jgi:hypothetical protein
MLRYFLLHFVTQKTQHERINRITKNQLPLCALEDFNSFSFFVYALV